ASTLRFILRNVKELEEDLTNIGLLRRLLFSMAALEHHDKHGGLKSSHARSLAELAFVILNNQGLNPRSRLRFLFGDLFAAQSKADRREGDHWSASWGQLMCERYHDAQTPVAEKSRYNLTAGQRAFRLGNTHIALKFLEAAEAGELNTRERIRGRVAQIRIHRLRNDYAKADELINNSLEFEDITNQDRLRLVWERLSMNVQ